ncbi:MAG: hypothetical protein ACI9B8_001455, partial [Sulfitobacter sp.]
EVVRQTKAQGSLRSEQRIVKNDDDLISKITPSVGPS